MDFENIFFDTNIVLDIIDETRNNHKNANLAFKFCVFSNCKIFISEDMLSTIFYIHKDKEQVLKFLDIIQNDWTISPYGNIIVQKAISLSLENNLDLEDVMQCLCAKKNGCEVLITNDNKFYDCGLSIYKTAEFLDKYSLS